MDTRLEARPGLAMAVRAAMAWVEPERSFPTLMRLLDPMAGIEAMSVTVIEGAIYRHLFDHPAGPADDKVSPGSAPIEGTSLEEVRRVRRALVIEEGAGPRHQRDAPLFPRPGRARAIVPILDDANEEVIATLNVVFSEASGANERSLALLTAVAEWGALGIRNTILFDAERRTVRQLREREQLKDDLIAMVAHDLRAPLSVIIGAAEILDTQWANLPDDKKIHFVGSILRSARNLHRFAVEALQEAHVGSEEFEVNVQRFDVADVIELAVEGLEREGVARIRVTRDEDLPLGLGDPLRHWQILSNLLTNALKFSSPTSLVDVDASFVEGAIQISVKDEGPGIEPEDVDKVFERFWRPRPTKGQAAAVTGTGLGLYICKRLVEAQGGSIWVESAPGEGATFYYTIPPAG